MGNAFESNWQGTVAEVICADNIFTKACDLCREIWEILAY